MRNCPECETPMVEYILLDHVTDLGGVSVELRNAVHVRRCPKCEEEQTMIPDLRGLAKVAAIARALLPVRFSGEEIRFFRRALNMTQAEFAEAMEMTPETVSRWENNVRGTGDFADKMVRHNVCALLKDAVPGMSYDPAEIVRMRPHALPEGTKLPPIPIERVRLKTGAHREDTWDPVLPIAA